MLSEKGNNLSRDGKAHLPGGHDHQKNQSSGFPAISKEGEAGNQHAGCLKKTGFPINAISTTFREVDLRPEPAVEEKE